jgi:hypothetical protein
MVELLVRVIYTCIGKKLKQDHSKVIGLFIFGYRIEAIRLIGTEVMLPRGLLGLGIDTVDHSRAEIRQALELYTSSAALPVLVHCTQGKDRTGMLAAWQEMLD